MSASAVIADVRQLLAGDPVFLAGSLVAEETYDMSDAHGDVDLFTPNDHVLVAMVQKLIGEGFTFNERMERSWYRWLRYGFNKWHTNSMRMLSPQGIEFNLVYKLTNGHPTTSLAQVLESFDFGLLATGYDLETGKFLDMRSFLFPDHNPDGPLPMMPNKRDNWRQGFISQYNGLRETGRYAKYTQYGYDLSLVKDDLSTGYWEAASYLTNAFKPEQQQLGRIYETIAKYIDGDDIDGLIEAYKTLDYNDSLDAIMEALE